MIELLQGCCLDVLPTLPQKSAHCCVTSPPYWALRDYGTEQQLGLEKTPEEYVANMVEVFSQVKRVLRDDGTLWLNLGDSYANAGVRGVAETQGGSCKEKDLVGIPWMVAFALRADGWYLRSDIIWHKPNPMPGSQQDRPTTAHEYLFLLSKSRKYYYDQEAIREPDAYTDHRRNRLSKPEPSGGLMSPHQGLRQEEGRNGMGRIKRSVWTITTQPYSAAHFATFPQKLVEPCILAGTSEEGCCAACGAPYERVTERETIRRDRPNSYGKRSPKGIENNIDQLREGVDVKTVGWNPTCCHDSSTEAIPGDPQPCTVLDPFCGSGTTGQVARQYGRSFIGIELNAEYLELARKRINVEEQRLFV